MQSNVSAWTHADLVSLLGQSESFRLEFKSGRLFSPRDRAIEVLSKEISAFANSEGGVIVLGISESASGKTAVADGFDGIDAQAVPLSWLQQTVEASVSPLVAGLRFVQIPLDDQPGRVCIVISVPSGTTAYQAQDRRYYGRSEFEAKPLADHDVRLRMQKGRVKRAGTRLGRWLTPNEMLAHGRRWPVFWGKDGDLCTRDPDYGWDMGIGEVSEGLWEALMEGRSEPDDFKRTVVGAFSLSLVNEGELTIRDASLVLSSSDEPLFFSPQRFTGVKEAPRWEAGSFLTDFPALSRLHPGQSLGFPTVPFSLRAALGETISPGDLVLEWTVYVEDGLPSRGAIDLGVEMGLVGTVPTGKEWGGQDA